VASSRQKYEREAECYYTFKFRWLETCIYCGQGGQCWDHVFPLSQAAKHLRQSVARVRGEMRGCLYKVRACQSCNSIASARPFYSVKEKRRFIQQRLTDRHQHLLKMPIRDASEIAGLGPRERSAALRAVRSRLSIEKRVLYPALPDIPYDLQEMLWLYENKFDHRLDQGQKISAISRAYGSPQIVDFKGGAKGGTRTPTTLRPPAPQADSYANTGNENGREINGLDLTTVDQYWQQIRYAVGMVGTVPRKQTTETLTTLYDGKLRLERRNGSPKISARTYLQGRLVQKSTGEITIGAATKVATNWYLGLLDRIRKGENLHGDTFAELAEKFLTHADLVREVSEGQRKNYRDKWSLLKPHFEGKKLTDIDTRFLLVLRDARSKAVTKNGKNVRPATLKKDMDFVRLVLRHGKSIEKCIDSVPEFPSFRGEAWEVVPNPRPFLDHEQWVAIRKFAKARISEADLNPRTQRQRQELYWFMLISVGAALRVDEAYSLRWKDCQLVTLNDKDKTEVVHFRVLGKHARGGQREDGYGMFGAVSAFKAMQRERPEAQPEDKIFLEQHREGIKELFIAGKVREDEEGRTRDSKSLRQTGISLRLELGPNPDYRDIAKWARTSPAMIAAFYDQTHPKSSVERIVGFRKREE
jgi:hypothetical protein